MKITIENKYLMPAVEFLQGFSLKAADSRARSKFVKLLSKGIEDLQEYEAELIKEYAELDVEGNPVSTDGGESFSLKEGKSVSEFKEQQAILINEEAVISLDTYSSHLDRLKNLLENYDEELSGQEAEVYDILLDAIEGTLRGGVK